MRHITRDTLRVAIALIASPIALSAQSSSRDSPGVRIVTNTRPAWNERQRLRLDSTPLLVIGNDADSSYRFGRVRGVMRLSDGRIVVADGASMQLRMFSPDGRFVSASAGKGIERGQMQQMRFVRRLRGDTIAINSAFWTLEPYSGSGQYARTITLPVRADLVPPGLLITVAVLSDGRPLAAPLHEITPRPTGSRWVDSLTLRLCAAVDHQARLDANSDHV